MLRTVALAPVLALFLAPAVHAASAEKTEELTWDVEAGTALSVTNVNGDIRLRPSADGKLHVKAAMKAKGSDAEEVRSALDRVKIKAEKVRGRLAVKADIPVDVKGGGILSAIFGKDVTVTVDYDLRLPKGVESVVETVNGEVDSLSTHNDLSVKSVNGAITIAEHSGSVTAETVNGALNVELARPVRGGTIVLSTVNGAIELGLQAGSKAEVTAETLNGSIRADFDLPVSSRLVGSELEGQIGDGEGGASIKIESINGAIHIAKTGESAKAAPPPPRERAPEAEPEGEVESQDLPQ